MNRRNTFPYPGGKTDLAAWVVDHLPPHETFIDAMHGGGSVLVQKPESEIEVVNDRDGDIVQFLRVLRERPGDLAAWLRRTTVAFDTHRRFANQFYAGFRPDDPVERAGRFVYLRHSQYGGKYDSVSGVRTNSGRDTAGRLQRWIDACDDLAERYTGVQVENRDYRRLFDRFDHADVCWYIDPPYPDAAYHFYLEGEGFDHDELAGRLASLDGDWLVSYEVVPDAVASVAEAVVERQNGHTQGHDGDRGRTERLAVSFDPSSTPSWVDTVGGAGRQSRLAEL